MDANASAALFDGIRRCLVCPVKYKHERAIRTVDEALTVEIDHDLVHPARMVEIPRNHKEIGARILWPHTQTFTFQA